MGKLILLRGPSGTGKSTISRHIFNQSLDSFEDDLQVAAFHETDHFFTDLDGKYHFQMGKLREAHRWNQLQAERSMLHGAKVVIVANTFIAHWEMERYLELAEEYSYDVEIIRTPGPWDANVLFKRNEHSVPLDVIKRHINGFQPHEDEVEWSDMSIFKS